MEGTTKRCTSDVFSPRYRVHRDVLETMASLSLTGERTHLRECMTTSNSDIKINAEAIWEVYAYRSQEA